MPIVEGVEDVEVVPPNTPFEVADALDAAYLVKRHGGRFVDVVDAPKPDILMAEGSRPKPKPKPKKG